MVIINIFEKIYNQDATILLKIYAAFISEENNTKYLLQILNQNLQASELELRNYLVSF